MTRFANASAPLKCAYIGLGLAVLAFLFVAIWTLIALAGLNVLGADTDLIKTPRWLWSLRENPTVGRWNAIGMGVAGLVNLGVLLGVMLTNKTNQHGEARFANESEIVREGMRAKKGILLGKQGGRYLTFGGPEHVICYAPTRAGKGVGVVIPNLFNWADSLVVLDIKKENWAATAGFRAAHGQRVVMFDPLDPAGHTARYNPLGFIDRASEIDCLDELQKIATMLFPTPKDGDPFWAEAARSGFIGVGALVAQSPDLPFTIGEIYRQLTQGDPKSRLMTVLARRELEGPALSSGCRSSLGDFLSASDNTFASIKQTITSRMSLWVNPRVDAATSASDFDLRELRTRPTSIYLGTTPDNMDRVAPLYNLFFQQLVDLNTRELPGDGKHPLQCLVLLDEFARLGHATVIAKGFSYVAGYGLRLLPIIQSPSQLRAEYGPDVADEIMTNCGVEIVFTPKELKVAQELSERLGYFDFKAKSKSKPTMLASGKRSTTVSDQKRALMLPQELMQMDRGKLIVLRGGIPAVQGEKILSYQDKDFTSRAKPAPALKPMSGLPPALPSGVGAVAALQAQVASMAASIEEIRKVVVVERRMTVEEAAGEAPLDLAMVAMTLDDRDIELPPLDAPETAFDDWVGRFVDASFTPANEITHA